MEIITQSNAARLIGVSRQRINQLVKEARFTTPVKDGVPMHRALYLDEVLNLQSKKRGRPKKLYNDWFKLGDTINCVVKLGRTPVELTAKVIEINVKIKVEFQNGWGGSATTWIKRSDCKKL